MPVAIPTVALPRRFMARVVAREEAVRLTMLFPIKMALSIFPESFRILRTV